MNIALILSGGTGTRLGAGIPKQYIEVCGRPIISYCLERLASHNKIDAIQIVADQAWQGFILEGLGHPENLGQPDGMGRREDPGKLDGMKRSAPKGVSGKFRGFSMPGKNRQLSILNGLRDIMGYADTADYVLVHDAARPLLSGQLITGCLNAAAGHDGVVPVLPMKDTVYASVDGKHVSSLLKRDEIYAGQAPEVFALGKYYEANRRLMPDKILEINGSTEPAVMAGMDIVMISGEEDNFKITTKDDLGRFREMVGTAHERHTAKECYS